MQPLFGMQLNNDIDGASELLRNKGVMGGISVILIEDRYCYIGRIHPDRQWPQLPDLPVDSFVRYRNMPWCNHHIPHGTCI